MDRLRQLPEGFFNRAGKGALGGVAVGVLSNFSTSFYNPENIASQATKGVFVTFWPAKFGTMGALYGAGRAMRLSQGEGEFDKALITGAIAGTGLALAESFGYYIAGGLTQNLPIDLLSPSTIIGVGIPSLVYYGFPNLAAYTLGRTGVVEKGFDKFVKPHLEDLRDKFRRPRQ